MVKWISIDQISKRTGISESMIINYTYSYGEHLDYRRTPDNAGKNNGVMYHPETCEKVLRIYELSQKDYTKEQIQEVLTQEFDNQEQEVDLQESETGLSERDKIVSQNIKAFTEAFDKIVEQRQEINGLRDRLDELESRQEDINQKYGVEISQLKRGTSRREKNKILGFSPSELLMVVLIVTASVVVAIMVLEII